MLKTAAHGNKSAQPISIDVNGSTLSTFLDLINVSKMSNMNSPATLLPNLLKLCDEYQCTTIKSFFIAQISRYADQLDPHLLLVVASDRNDVEEGKRAIRRLSYQTLFPNGSTTAVFFDFLEWLSKAFAVKLMRLLFPNTGPMVGRDQADWKSIAEGFDPKM